jgi:hypothetical protein
MGTWSLYSSQVCLAALGVAYEKVSSPELSALRRYEGVAKIDRGPKERWKMYGRKLVGWDLGE